MCAHRALEYSVFSVVIHFVQRGSNQGDISAEGRVWWISKSIQNIEYGNVREGSFTGAPPGCGVIVDLLFYCHLSLVERRCQH